MGLLSFLKRQPEADKPTPRPASPDDVERARTRARRRLIGAVVLLGVGIIGFPLVFETQPRPIPVDLPIEIPRKDSVPPLATPPPRSSVPRASGPVTAEAPAPQSAAASAPQVVASAPAPAAEVAQSTEPSRPPASTPPPRETPKPPVAQPKPATPPASDKAVADASRAKALLDDQADAAGRFVVQVGAFADAAAAGSTRSKIEKLGMKTHTQSVDTSSGKRIRVRVGPFASRDEADKAAARIKSAGFGPQVLAL
jgi:DedD protein